MSIKRALRYLLAGALILLLFLSVDLGTLVEAFSNINLEVLFYLILISVALLYISAMKWGFFLERFGAPVSVAKLFNLYLIGYFVNLLMPSYVGGDVARSYYLGKEVGQHQAFAATILERYTGLVAMVSMAFVFVWLTEDVTAPIKWSVVLVTLLLVISTVVVLSRTSLRLLSTIPGGKKLTPHFEKIREALLLARSDRKLLLKTLLFSYLFHFMTVVNTFVCALAVGWEAPIFRLFVVVPLILMVSALPLAPNSLGIQEGAFFYFLKLVGATSAEALGVALILRAKSYLLAVWGWGVWLRLERTSKLTSKILPQSTL